MRLFPPQWEALCARDDVPDGASRGFGEIFAVRLGAEVRVYVNACPHLGLPLEWMADRFLSADGSRIVCAMHGAEFRLTDGLCTVGPCLGAHLAAVPVMLRDGMVMVPAGALAAGRKRV